MIKKIFPQQGFWKQKKSWIYLLIGLMLLNYFASFINLKIDCTEEKKYTLSKASRQLLNQLDDRIFIRILMKDDLPTEFKKLKNSVNDLLEELSPYAHQLIKYEFINPLNFTNDSLKNKFLDTLNALAIRPTNVSKQTQKKGSQEKKIVFPAAILQYKNKIVGINFLSETLINSIPSLNNAEALLEYKFTNAIEKLTQEKKSFIAYAVGHGEPLGYEVVDMFQSLYPTYNFDTLNLKNCSHIDYKKYDLLLMVKPLTNFSDYEKLKIDQFILNGGKAIFMIDNVFAEMQNLQEKKQMVAQNINLQLDDLLFHYGVRIEYNLIQDLQCDRLPIQIGWNGDKPQFELLPWYYFPLLNPNNEHPITKSLDLVLGNFVSSMTLNKDERIEKTILLTSSQQSRKQGTPSIVNFETLKENPDPQNFQNLFLPTAVLLKSNYASLYANRITEEIKNKYETASQEKIMATATNPTRIIVVSDGDVVINPVTQKEGPLKMGMNPYTKMQFANSLFFQNCLEYLLSKTQIIENRNKNFTLRLLNKKKIEAEIIFWQSLNIILPIFICIFFYSFYFIFRWRKYAH